MTRDDYIAQWRAMSQKEKLAEAFGFAADFALAFLLIGLVAASFKFLPVLVAVGWALAGAVEGFPK